MRAAFFESDGVAQRQRHGKTNGNREIPVQLEPDVFQLLVVLVAGIGFQHAAEDRAAHRVQIKRLRADILETQRREIEFGRRFREIPRGYLIDAETGEAVEIAIALDLAIVDIVVAEGAEIEIVEHVRGVAARGTDIVVEPQ